MLNRIESTEVLRAISTVVYTHEYPITLHMVGIGQMSRPNARCLPKLFVLRVLLMDLLKRLVSILVICKRVSYSIVVK